MYTRIALLQWANALGFMTLMLASSLKYWATAQAQSLFAPPTGFWMAPAKRPLKPFAPTDPGARWFIAQWGNPHPLGGFQPMATADGSPAYKAASGTARVTVSGRGAQTQYTFLHDGEDIPCSADKPHEFDLFAQGVDRAVDPDVQPAAIDAAALKSTTLAQMAGLEFTAKLGIGRQWAADGANSCPMNAVNVLAAVVLRNNTATPPQVFFYQLSLYQYCSPGPRVSACEVGRRSRFFWWPGNVDRRPEGRPGLERFAYRDTLASFDTTQPGPGHTSGCTLI